MYINKRATFVGRNHETFGFGYTGFALTDASSSKGRIWFLADGIETASQVLETEVWFDDDAYVIGPPNYK